MDCVAKGKEICNADSQCFGIMYHASWGPLNKGVKWCASTRMEPKGDWKAYMKCNNDGKKRKFQ